MGFGISLSTFEALSVYFLITHPSKVHVVFTILHKKTEAESPRVSLHHPAGPKCSVRSPMQGFLGGGAVLFPASCQPFLPACLNHLPASVTWVFSLHCLCPLILGPRAQCTAVQGQWVTPSMSSTPWSCATRCPTQRPYFTLASCRAIGRSWDYKLHGKDLWIRCKLFCLKILLLGTDIQAPGKKQECCSGSDWRAQREA